MQLLVKDLLGVARKLAGPPSLLLLAGLRTPWTPRGGGQAEGGLGFSAGTAATVSFSLSQRGGDLLPSCSATITNQGLGQSSQTEAINLMFLTGNQNPVGLRTNSSPKVSSSSSCHLIEARASFEIFQLYHINKWIAAIAFPVHVILANWHMLRVETLIV